MSKFDSARRSALMQDLLRQLQGGPADLLPFEHVKEKLRLKQIVDRGTMDVPLDRIIGSVGREREFNRAFLPREEALRSRWEEVHDLAESSRGFPAVELYYVNDIYFVVDGHHRVSVARSVKAPSIEARVKEFVTLVPLTRDTTLEDVILRSGLADFLQTTGLEQSDRDEFRVTIPNGYERLAEHISVHRYYRGVDLQHPVSWDEAVESWRTSVFHPMIDTIRKSGIMADFPGYTEADLYLFTMDHLHYLREQYGHAGEQRDRVVRHFALSRKRKKKSES